MSELNLSKKTDLEKIRAIYRYITQNVTYDYAHENDSSYYLQNTAYGALVNGTACCQGIANLQYRMLKEAGLECHIVAGTASGLRHAWVVVNVDGSNYYLDATWDLGKSEQGYGHFLTGTTEDPEHIMDDEYKEKYSISKTAYVKFVASPTLSKVENVNGGVKVTWKAVSGAVRYRVYHKTASGKWELLGNTTGTSFTDKKVSGGTTYTYTVRCVTADNRSFTSGYNSKGLSIKYIASPELSSVSNAAKGVTVKWSASKGAEKYRVYRKTGSSGWTKLYDTTSTSYTDTSAQSGTTYYYTVRCITANGKSTTSNYNSKGLSIKHIAAPKLSSVSNVAKGVTVKWSASKGAEKYRVYRKTGSSGWTKLADTTSTSYTDKTAKAGTTYT
jgi:fibronectin type 3 domain-containing protein